MKTMCTQHNRRQILLLILVPIVLSAQAQSEAGLAASDALTDLWRDGNAWYALSPAPLALHILHALPVEHTPVSV